MESPGETGYPEWNLLKSWATSDGIHNGAIYVLLFSSSYYQMESRCTDKMGALDGIKIETKNCCHG
jgi:hypothetical protein